ncbi:TrkH family potassium uptake protein [Spirulina subsalsa FACHB-351]|uniref:TrkH family potassium uptake protein n=1 Tax=Spirulina subsalsa FACHB-351 TaxID=234711 RepID=A0ABT3L6B2_9CYAN|nr:TrkH family potassium uptake protein [Spirulina subsalsa]MCW6037042.1 TrkH family potassium uptake protein [Spirulina subsalsa FACHB-351]
MTIARTICLGFLAVISVGTLLLLLPISTSSGDWNSPLVAIFTATSAVCVTGLIVVDTGSHFSTLGQCFILLLIQIGGLGYMTTSTFLLLVLRRKFDLRQKLAIQESFDRPFLQGSQHLIRSIIITTFFFELTGLLIILKPFQEDYGFLKGLWIAFFHSISAWNNAGFSLFADSLMGYQHSIAINIGVPLLIIFGGIGYQVILELQYWIKSKLSGQRVLSIFSLNTKVVVRVTAFLLISGTIGFFTTEFLNLNTLGPLTLKDKLLAAWFQSVTTRTAGFNSVDFGSMSDTALFITIAFMFIGASPSGTGGGLKTTTLGILINCTRSTLRGHEQVIMHSRKIPTSLIYKAIAVVLGSATMVVSVTTLLSITEAGKFDFIHLLFEVVSAFATVGLSTGITADLSEISQIILIFTMYTGRIGILVFMAAIFGDPRPTSLQYPEENLLVG